MRRSPFLIVAIVALAAATAAIAGPVVNGPDGNTQSIDSLITPKKLSKTKFTPGTLSVTTLTTSTTDPSGVPVPAVHATIDFDKNATLFTKGLPTCDPAKLQNQSTESAERACGNAKIGSGHAIAYLRSGRIYEVPQTVTAFNGVPKSGVPRGTPRQRPGTQHAKFFHDKTVRRARRSATRRRSTHTRRPRLMPR